MQRHSAKRDAIIQCVRATKSHPTAEWVYGQLKPRFPDLSLATVYRNLSQLRQQGVLRCLETDGTFRFDGDLSPHIHFRCRVCGELTDYPTAVEIPTVPGASVERVETVLYGVCPKCSQK